MSGIIDRLGERTATTDERVRVIEMADGDADAVLEALSAETRRQAFLSLFDEPRTTSELADRLDTSVQNAHHHLSQLQDVGLVEPVDTVYSEKGNEMTVFGPASDPLVFVGDSDRVPLVERSIPDVVTGLGLVAVASLLVQWGAERLVRTGGGTDNVGPAWYGPAAGDPGAVPWLVFGVFEPGLLFFLGCLLVGGLVVLAARR